MKSHNKGSLLFSKYQAILATHPVKGQIVSPFQQNHCLYLYICKGRSQVPCKYVHY